MEVTEGISDSGHNNVKTGVGLPAKNGEDRI